MKHEFVTPHSRWEGNIPDSPTNFAKRAASEAKAAATSAWNLEQSLTDAEQQLDEIKAIVAMMRDAAARLASMVPNMDEADRAWEAREAAKEEKRKQIVTANAAREFAEQQAQHNPWRNK